MSERKDGITRKLVRTGGWTLIRRGSKMVPYVGTAFAIALVGADIRRKGVVFGIANSTLDAIPFVGFTKNAIELVAGDLFPDRRLAPERKK